MNDRRQAGSSVALILGALVIAPGCGPKQATAPKPSPSPSPSAAAPPLEATVRDLQLSLTDPKGSPIARITAKAGTVGPGGEALGSAGYKGALLNGTATLYQEGKPAATLRADKLEADQATRTVTGRGNVVVTSLQSEESPAIRADEMIWRYDEDKVTGRGNVVVSKEPDTQVSAERFEADTRMRDFTLFDGSRATGSF